MKPTFGCPVITGGTTLIGVGHGEGDGLEEGLALIELEGDGDRETELEMDGEADADGDRETELEIDGESDADRLLEIDGESDADAELDGDGLAEVELEIDGDRDADAELDRDGDRELEAELDGDGLAETLDEIDEDGDGDAEIDGESDADGDDEIDGLASSSVYVTTRPTHAVAASSDPSAVTAAVDATILYSSEAVELSDGVDGSVNVAPFVQVCVAFHAKMPQTISLAWTSAAVGPAESAELDALLPTWKVSNASDGDAPVISWSHTWTEREVASLHVIVIVFDVRMLFVTWQRTTATPRVPSFVVLSTT